MNLTKIRRGNACDFSDFVTGQWACCRRVACGLVDNVPVAHRVHSPSCGYVDIVPDAHIPTALQSKYGSPSYFTFQ